MKEKIYENGIEYILVGDYYLPNIVMPHKKHHIGKYGMLHRDYIKEHYPWFYARTQGKGELNDYLEKIDMRARSMVDDIISKSAQKQGITEELKITDQMKWVGLMNNLKTQAEEFVFSEIVYAEVQR